ncbi:MAG: hypothetical protein P0S96_03230 [Simkaniaceae bacterium]|nr:hypothetical protein [Candidatus Sacchlamyda saccharinae]
MAAVTLSSPPVEPPPPSQLDTLFANLAPYFQASYTNIYYATTPATPKDIAHLEQVLVLLSAVTTESELVDSNAQFLFYFHPDHQLQIDYFWVIKHVVLPYAIAYDKKDEVTTILSLAAHFLGKGEHLTQVIDLANTYTFENPKFGALPEDTAQTMWTHIQAVFPKEEDPPAPVRPPAKDEYTWARTGRAPLKPHLAEKRNNRRCQPY